MNILLEKILPNSKYSLVYKYKEYEFDRLFWKC